MTILPFAALMVATNLSTIVVEASRLGHEPLAMAQYVEVLTASDIANTGASDLPALAAHLPGLNVYQLGAGNPALAQVQMRGYGENGYGRVLLCVDGEYLNSFDMYSPNYALVPLSAIRRLEVLHGPQTVLYGDAASAGMINVVTDAANYDHAGYVELKGGSWGTVQSAAGVRGGLADERLAYFADASYVHSDGYRDHSGYDIWNWRGGLRKDFNNGSFLKFSTFFNDSEYDLPGPRQSRYDDWAHLNTFGANFSGQANLNEENSLSWVSTFSQRRSHYTYNDAYSYESYLWNYRFAPQYKCSAEVASFRNELIAGSELKYNYLDGEYRADRWTLGGFAQDEFRLFDELSLVAGGRLERDWNSNSETDGGGRNDNFVAEEVALNYHPIDNAKLFMRWTRYYRNPFADEYSWRNGRRSETTKPERGWNAELGGAWDIAEEWQISAVGYYSENKNEIHYNPFAMSNENSPWLHRREGLDLSLAWEREKTASFKIGWSGVNAEKAEGKYKGNWVPGVPRQQLNLEGRWWLWNEFSISAGYRLLGSRYAISDTPNANGRLHAESIFRVGCRYRPDWRYLRGFTFAFNCENLFDRDYCDYAVASVYSGQNAYYPAAGRSFMFSLRYDF